MKTKTTLIILLITGYLIALISCTQPQQKTSTDETVRNKANTEILFKVFDEADTAAFNALVGEGFTDHQAFPPEIKSTGIQGAKEMSIMLKTGFPDIKTTINSMVAEGDMVAVYYTSEGTNTGSIMGISATGKRIKADGADFFKFKDGKMIEHWGLFDSMKMMEQLGQMPAKSAAAPRDTASIKK